MKETFQHLSLNISIFSNQAFNDYFDCNVNDINPCLYCFWNMNLKTENAEKYE